MNAPALNQRALEIQKTLTRESIPAMAALLGWNRRALGKAAGVTYDTLSDVIAGRRSLTPKVARKLALALACGEEELRQGDPLFPRVLEIQKTLTPASIPAKAALLGWNRHALGRAAGFNSSSLYLMAAGCRGLTPRLARKVALALAKREAELGV